jgi:hypothetical protein
MDPTPHCKLEMQTPGVGVADCDLASNIALGKILADCFFRLAGCRIFNLASAQRHSSQKVRWNSPLQILVGPES